MNQLSYYQEFYSNLNQILKLNTKNKLVEVNDYLQLNTFGIQDNIIDLSNLSPKQFTSNIHSHYSKIELQSVDYSDPKHTKVAAIKLDPNELKAIYTQYLSPNHSYPFANVLLPVYMKLIRVFGGFISKVINKESPLLNLLKEATTKLEAYEKECKEKNVLYSCEKINPYQVDDKGYSPVSKLNILYCPTLRLKWKISIEVGLGIKDINTQTGGLICKKDSYKKSHCVDILLNDFQMSKLLTISNNYINHWELCNMSKFLSYRNQIRTYLMEKFQQSNSA